MEYEFVPQGTVAEGFESVREEFAAAARAEGGDYAGQLAVYADGEPVVDLWVGPEIDGESLTGVFSCGKGAAHLVVALLVQDGVLDLDERVAHYWPEFAAQGKQDVTLRQLISHRAGLAGVEGGLTLAEAADDRLIAERLAAQRPYWLPGAASGYHALTIGALLGEVVFRATGRTLQETYEQRVRAPHGIDLYLGLPESEEYRFLTTQPMRPTEEQRALMGLVELGPQRLASIAFNEVAPPGAAPAELSDYPNHRVFRAGGQASAGGVGNARGLARLYAAAVSGVAGGEPLLSADTVGLVGQIQSCGHDLVMGRQFSFALGFQAVAEAFPVLGQGSFGHSGAVGSLGLADPRAGFAYGYTRRRFAFPGGAAPENTRLLSVVHRAVREARGERR